MSLDESRRWLVIRSTGTGPLDGECVVYDGTLEEVKQYATDTNYGKSEQDAQQGLWSIFIPMSIVLTAINQKMLTLEDLDLGL